MLIKEQFGRSYRTRHGLLQLRPIGNLPGSADTCLTYVFFFLCIMYSALLLTNHTTDQLIRDLGWVGFDLITLSHWIDDGRHPRTGREGTPCFSDTSDFWLFVGMEL